MGAVTVRRLDDQDVCAVDLDGIADDGKILPAQIAGEKDAQTS